MGSRKLGWELIRRELAFSYGDRPAWCFVVVGEREHGEDAEGGALPNWLLLGTGS